MFNKAAIIGVGLLGASLALALKERGICKDIYGCGRREDNLRSAMAKGIISGYSLDVRSATADADLVALSTPVGAFKEIAEKIKGALKKGAIVTDVGSVKGQMVYELESQMPEGAYYIGSHPIAGSDKSGIDDARADLFNNALCIITPTKNSDVEAVEKISSLWIRIGCSVERMDAFKHDEIYGAVSHLPHIVAYALVNALNDVNPDYIRYAGQGFKDTTRIALSSPEMWRDIAVFNKENLLKLTQVFRDNIKKMEALLQSSDSKGIEREIERAQALRKRLR
ncbi:MAG: prephenate dehydrogenase/arogenate dehydrogenase family protein [Nitrospirae bacterium]|nr:prephenate dehydrogenase/arogenate dehydrogenase family protein [Nitrospirota bacterium]